jgi:hypothetical protein
MMATFFWDVHRIRLDDFTPTGSKINAAAYKEIPNCFKKAIWQSRTSIYSERWKSNSEVTSAVMTTLKIKSRNGQVPRKLFL